jgi:hypothetical protein
MSDETKATGHTPGPGARSVNADLLSACKALLAIVEAEWGWDGTPSDELRGDGSDEGAGGIIAAILRGRDAIARAEGGQP